MVALGQHLCWQEAGNNLACALGCNAPSVMCEMSSQPPHNATGVNLMSVIKTLYKAYVQQQ